jgi:xeroderma pigmentosum group C-complementing protein
LQAYWEAEQEAAKRESEKRHDRVIKRWTRLVQGLRIRQRLQAQYASDMPKETTVTVQVEAVVDIYLAIDED